MKMASCRRGAGVAMWGLLVSCLWLGAFAAPGMGEEIVAEDPQLGREVDFYRDVYPILENKCLACHSGSVRENELVLESAAAILKGGISGEAVVPGKPDESYFFRVSARVDEPVMPPLPNKVQAKALTPRELGIFKQWILEGAKGGERQVDTSIAWQPVPESYKAVYSLALDPEQRFVYAGRGNRIFAYDLVTGQEVARFSDPALLSLRHEDQPLYGAGVAHRDFVHALAIHPNGQLLASGGYRVVKLWEREAPGQLASVALGSAVRQSALNADGTLAAFLLPDAKLAIVNLTNGQLVRTVETEAGVTGVAFAPKGEQIIAAATDGTLKLIDAVEGDWTPAAKLPAEVQAVTVSAADSLLITADGDHVVRIWNWDAIQQPAENEESAPKPVHELKGHSEPITVLQVAGERKELLTGSRDATVRLWNLADGQQLFSQNLEGVPVAVSLTADGQHLVAAGENKLVRVWNRNGQKVVDIKGLQQQARAVLDRTDDQVVAKAQVELANKAVQDTEKDLKEREESLTKANEQKEKVTKELAEADTKLQEAKTAAEAAAAKLAENAEDEALKKAKEEADKALATAEEARKKANDAVTSANRAVELSQQSVATAKKNVEQRQQQKAAAEERQKESEAALAAANEAVAQNVPDITSVALTAGGMVLTTTSTGNQLQNWNLKSGQGVGVTELPVEQIATSQQTPAGTLLVIDAAGTVTNWDLTPRWNLVAVLGVDAANTLDVSKSTFEDRVTALAFSPDGKLLATGGGEPSRNGEVILWDVETRQVAKQIVDAHSDSVSDLQFSRDGTLLVSGASDKFVKVFKTADGSLLRSYEGHTDHVLGVSFRADQSSLVSSGADLAIKVWNLETGEQQRTISNYGKQVTSVSFVGVTENIISSGGDKTVKLHKTSNGQNYRSFAGSTDFVYRAIVTSDESLVIAAGEDGVVRVWNGKDGALLSSFAPPQEATETAQR